MSEGRWTRVLALSDVPEGRTLRADAAGTQVLLYRWGERILALGNRCTHQGAPLDRGYVRVAGSEATVTCPAHGSVFRLTDGRVVRPPAREPVAAFDTRVTDGMVEIRPRAGDAERGA